MAITATSSTIRAINRSIILNLVRLHEPVSRKELSDLTGMFCSNVSVVVDGLVREGLILEQEARPIGRGRVPVNLFLNPNGYRVVGVNIRPERTWIAWAGLAGRVLGSDSFPTPQDPRVFPEMLGGALQNAGNRTGRRSGGIRRIGLSIPGLVHPSDGRIVMAPALPKYAGYPIAAETGRRLGIPAVADNDCNVAVLAELWSNKTDVGSMKDVVLLSVSDYGVGAGLVLNSRLYRGHNLTWAGEVGHMVVDPAGGRCRCGRRGCWEVFVSNQATWRRYDRRRRFTPESFRELVRRALDQDARALKAFEQTAEYLSLGLSNITLAFNPECIVIAGEIARVWSLIRRTAESMWSLPQAPLQVRLSPFSLDDLYKRGAVTLALQEVFEFPHIEPALTSTRKPAPRNGA